MYGRTQRLSQWQRYTKTIAAYLQEDHGVETGAEASDIIDKHRDRVKACFDSNGRTPRSVATELYVLESEN